MGFDISVGAAAQSPVEQQRQPRQPVERHRRECMVSGVVGHVPGEKANDAAGEGGAGVGEHVGDQRAGCVLGQKIGAQKGLAQERGDKPQPDGFAPRENN